MVAHYDPGFAFALSANLNQLGRVQKLALKSAMAKAGASLIALRWLCARRSGSRAQTSGRQSPTASTRLPPVGGRGHTTPDPSDRR